MSKPTVRQRESGKYQYRFEKLPINGQRQREERGGFLTKEEALEAGKKAQERYLKGGDDFNPAKISYADFISRWLEHSKSILKYNTIESYSTIARIYIIPKLGSYNLASINIRTLNHFIKDLISENNFTQSYIRSIVKVLKASFRAALDLEYIAEDPTISLRLPNNITYKESNDKHIYTQRDIDIITERFKDNKTFLMAFNIARFTGLRTSEVFALTWENIDFDNNCIIVRNNIHDQPKDEKGRWYLGSVKTKAGKRIIPLANALKEKLLQFKAEQDEYKRLLGNNYIYYHLEECDSKESQKNCKRIVRTVNENVESFNLILVKENGLYVGTDLLKYPFKVIRNELGLECRFYDNRLTFATISYTLNHNDLDAIKNILGHSDTQTTMDYYIDDTAKLDYAKMEQVMNQINNIFSNQE